MLGLAGDECCFWAATNCCCAFSRFSSSCTSSSSTSSTTLRAPNTSSMPPAPAARGAGGSSTLTCARRWLSSRRATSPSARSTRRSGTTLTASSIDVVRWTHREIQAWVPAFDDADVTVHANGGASESVRATWRCAPSCRLAALDDGACDAAATCAAMGGQSWFNRLAADGSSFMLLWMCVSLVTIFVGCFWSADMYRKLLPDSGVRTVFVDAGRLFLASLAVYGLYFIVGFLLTLFFSIFA